MATVLHLSIIIPTYNERENARLITYRIRNCLQYSNWDYEILFIDDSRDDTPMVLEELSKKYNEVRYIHREKERGLASAVVNGFHVARGEHIIVMDADLQHPPELVPLIMKRLTEADIVIPSRFITGGSDGGLSGLRKLISWTARTIGQLSIRRLRNISDCTSGYFGLNRSVIDEIRLDPIGWKILMEVLVKGRYNTVHEIPYTFESRDAGKSKMNLQEHLNYLLHIVRLVRYCPEDFRFYLFCLVGISGVFVNLVILKLLLFYTVLNGLIASLIASFIAMLHNFYLNDTLTWKERQHTQFWRKFLQFPQFALVCGGGIVITACIAHLVVILGGNIYSGQLSGIVFATIWNYAVNNRWTWGKTEQEPMFQAIITQERG